MNTLKTKLPKRFTGAMIKLYNAFHNNKLDAYDCEMCAVGSLVGHYMWYGLSINLDDPSQEDYMVIQTDEFIMGGKNESEYSLLELKNIEILFIKEFQKNKIKDGRHKESQFNGLCAVIEYLCELDNIPSVLDYTSLFEFNENNEPKNELILS